MRGQPVASASVVTQHTSSFGYADALSAVEEKILFAVYRLPYVRIEQLTRYLKLSPHSSKWLQKIVRGLIARSYLDVQPLPRFTPFGMLPHVYMLGTKGMRFFQENHFPVSYRSPKERVRKHYGFLIHAGNVTETLITMSRISLAIPAIRLASFTHDLLLQQIKLVVTLENNCTARLVPDGLLDFALSHPYGRPGEDRFIALLEVDDNQEEFAQFRPKVEKYVHLFEDGGYKVYGVPIINRVLVINFAGGAYRMNLLCSWIMNELQRLHKETYAPLFLVANMSQESRLDPALLLTAPLFSRPDRKQPVPVIEKLPL
jgi:hypothetical protein